MAASDRRALVAISFASLLLVAGAHAEPTALDKSMAETLFRDGKLLMEQGKYAVACPKLAESHRLDPGGGVVFALALCHEADGKTASAWTAFQEALTYAKKDKRKDRITEAEKRIAKLEAKLSRLTVTVAAGAGDLEVALDGRVLGTASLGSAIPVDPGSHKVTARAEGKKAWESTIEIGPNADKKSIEVPVLEEAPKTATEPPKPKVEEPKPALPPKEAPPPERSGGGLRTVGFVTAGIGVVALGVGGFFGLRAFGKQSDVKTLCPDSVCTSQEGVTANDQAKSAATISTITMSAGAVLAVVGVVFIAVGGPTTKEKQPTTTAWSLAPSLGPRGGGLVFDLAW